ncbi:unnamed protein product [Rotaria sordida]|uniref:F-box domain-containing protein n=1 Tax=Rotaria sordida TaxID=392033 RepID=A0A815RX39_9BILA|nr:unnamed protein product [Rotaria sordida]CAF1480650.1 unnamed protein product [Rotaria sordida]
MQSRSASTQDTTLRTKDFLSKQPLLPEEKVYYEECKEYYHLTGQPLISVAEEVFDSSTELTTSSLKLCIDEDCNQFDLQGFITKFCGKINLTMKDILIKKIQVGSCILEADIFNKFESNDKKLSLKMICKSITNKLREEFSKMRIFFMFMGSIKSLLNQQKHRAEIKLNPQYNRIYAPDRSYWLGALNDGIDRGNKPYYCPVGWKRCSFYVTDRFYEKFKGWCICYHGTKFEYGLSILLNGLKPAERAEHGAGIYVSPSINYVCHPRYAEVKRLDTSYPSKFFKSGKYVQFVLECRVHPSNIKKIAKETLDAGNTIIDFNIDNKIIEWVINNQNKKIVDFNDPDSSIVCTGIMMRVTDDHPGLLPESQWWYESHICNHENCCLLGINLDVLKRRRLDGYKLTTVDRNKFILENLANEIFYEIFEYLDIHDIYKSFFNLNKRFENLIINSNFLHQINISTISKIDFENFYINILIPYRYRINLFRLSNPFIADIIFSPPRIILQFIHLEKLILDKIQMKYLSKIFNYLTYLPKFHSLIISIGDYIESLDILFTHLFHLLTLKYCKIEYEIKNSEYPLSIYLTEYDSSSIQYLIINGCFPFKSLNNLLCCLPKLRYLSINYLVHCRDYLEREDLSPIKLKYLKNVSLKFDCIRFDKVEKILKNFFYYVQILRLTTRYDQAYLNAKRWEDLIVNYMPNLRIFDINHETSMVNNNLSYHDLINQFNSSFWIKKNWFFTHQHDWTRRLDSGIFYSTDPYRRKDYGFHWEIDEQNCSHIQETNLNSVQHVSIYSKQIINIHLNYFPNVTQLTIKHYFQTSDDSIITTLNRMIPLVQLTKLTIESYDFPFEEVIKLLRFTPNLYSLKLNLLAMTKTNSQLIKQNENFQYVTKTNKIKYLDLREYCTLNQIQLIVKLFPQLEYFKTRMNRKEIEPITKYLLLKTKNKIQHLFLLCISETPKICLKELNILIKSENLLKDYFIKFINRDLYLWW